MKSLVLAPWDLDNSRTRVRGLLDTLHRTQEQLASVLNVSPVTVNRWANGRTVPDRRSRAMLEKLEKTYVSR